MKNYLLEILNNMYYRLNQIIDFIFDNKSVNIVGKKKDESFPIIGDFHFVKEVYLKDHPKLYKYALYEDNKGNRGFAKQWVPSQPALNRYWLLNEINVYKELWRVIDSHENLNNKSDQVRIPRLYGAVEERKQLIILIEYIDGDLSFGMPESEKVQLTGRAIDFLSNINPYIRHDKGILKRTIFNWITILPFIATRAIIRNPQFILEILKSTFIFLINIPLLIKSENIGFVHRDLVEGNIILRNDTIYIIDFQLSVLANPIVEYAIMLVTSKDRFDTLSQLKLSSYSEHLFKNKYFNEVLRVYCIFFCIYDLSSQVGNDPKSIMSFLSYNLKN